MSAEFEIPLTDEQEASSTPFALVIWPDIHNDWNPREESNLGTMICFHRRYDLGDKHQYKDPDEFESFIDRHHLRDGKGGILHTLYMYDHSGLYLRMDRGFSDIDPARWDWGKIGYLYVTNDQIRECYGRLTKANIAKAEKVLAAEFADYNNYLQGNVFCYRVMEVDDSGNVLVDQPNDLIEFSSGGVIADGPKQVAELVLGNELLEEVRERVGDRIHFVDDLFDVIPRPPKRKLVEMEKIVVNDPTEGGETR